MGKNKQFILVKIGLALLFLIALTQAIKKLDINTINNETGAFLHQFKWLKDEEIGSLDERWNWLEGWTSNHNNNSPFAVHFTRGGPWFEEWQDVEFAEDWNKERNLYLEEKFTLIK